MTNINNEAWVRKMALAFFAANVAEAAGESFDLPPALSADEAQAIAQRLYEAEPDVLSQAAIAAQADSHDNLIAREGCDRCYCGCKYWEHDRCIDCGTHISQIQDLDR